MNKELPKMYQTKINKVVYRKFIKKSVEHIYIEIAYFF